MESTSQPPRPEQEGFGQAGLGEAQSEDPPADSEMIDEESSSPPETKGETGGESGTEAGGAGVEQTGGDQDAEAATSPEEATQDSGRDQAEG